MATTGTRTIEDLLAVQDLSVVDFGEDTVTDVLQRDLQNFNEQVMMAMSDLAETSTDRKRRYGTSQDAQMTRLDEMGSVATEKTRVGDTVEFPMFKHGRSVGWTADFLTQATPADLAKQQIATQKAYLAQNRSEIRSAIFLSSNYAVEDEFVDNVSLSVKRLVNADGAAIPNNQNNESFDGSTHTHYSARDWSGATDAEKNSDVRDLVDDVVEHDHGENVRLYINRAQEEAVMGLADFTKYEDPRIIFRNSDTPAETLDLSRLNNRAIGIIGAAEVWVKPWIPANYLFAFAAGDDEKTLVRRVHSTFGGGLRLVGEHRDYPLQADQFVAYFGYGAWNRTNGAVHYIGAGAYADPSL